MNHLQFTSRLDRLQKFSLKSREIRWRLTRYMREIILNGAVNVMQGDIVEQNENSIEEEVYEEYQGDNQENWPRYATYSNKSKSHMQKFLTKKMFAILVLLVFCLVGVVVALSVHLTRPPTTTVAPTTAVSRTTSVSPIETTSARGTLFPIELNVRLSLFLSQRTLNFGNVD